MISVIEWYLIGLIAGLAVYAITYIFNKDMPNKKRAKIVSIIGTLVLLISLFIIGGFEGMPIGLASLGIFTSAILLAFLGKYPLWRKLIYTIIITFTIFFLILVTFYKVDYWVINKEVSLQVDDVDLFIKQLQKDTSISGYKTFTVSEGDDAIVLALGGEKAGNNIEILDVKEQGDRTIIQIRTFYNQSKEPNPVIAFGLSRLKSEIRIIDTDGIVYKKVDWSITEKSDSIIGIAFFYLNIIIF